MKNSEYGSSDEEDMIKRMSVAERFKYMNDLRMLKTQESSSKAINNDWTEDKDIMDFLNAPANNKELNEMGDTHEYIRGGLSYDRSEGFKAFQAKQNQATEHVDREESEYDSSSCGEEDGGDASDGEDSNEY